MYDPFYDPLYVATSSIEEEESILSLDHDVTLEIVSRDSTIVDVGGERDDSYTIRRIFAIGGDEIWLAPLAPDEDEVISICMAMAYGVE